MNLREATLDDAELLFQWRNDESARHNSFSTDYIRYDEHLRWLLSRLKARNDVRIWILEEEGIPVGQIRYERDRNCGRISVSIDHPCRGRGLGATLLRMSAPLACDALDVDEVYGLTKPENAASARAFEKAGFRRSAAADTPKTYVRFGWRRALRE